MKARILILIAAALFLTAAYGQTDSTVYVKTFPGSNVGAKVAAAMATCPSGSVVPCILVIDPSMAAWPAGTMPALCANCSLSDYRKGGPLTPQNSALRLNAAWFGLSTTATGTANSTALNACLSYLLPGQPTTGQICEISPGSYHIAQSIIVEQGTSLVGFSSNSHDGSRLIWDGTAGCMLKDDVTNSGPMYGSEVGKLTLQGNGTGDTAVCLYPGPGGPPGQVPQFVDVHDLRIESATNGIEIQSCSYCTFQRVNAFGPSGGIGLNFSKTVADQFVELNKVLDSSFQNYATGLQIESPQSALNYFARDDFSQETAVGISIKWLNGGSWYFDGIDNSGDPAGIQFNPTGAETVYAGLYFDNYVALMPGASASEVTIGIAAGSNNNVSRLYFRNADIGKVGATVPTNSISLANAVNLEAGDIQFPNLLDTTGGAHLFPATPSMLQTPFQGINLWTGNSAEPDLNSTYDASNFLLNANELVSGTSYHRQTVKFSKNGCFGSPGVLFLGDANNGSGVARNSGATTMVGCFTNPNPWGETSGQEYGEAEFGQYVALEPHFQPGFDSVPDATDAGSFPAFRGVDPGTTNFNYYVNKDGAMYAKNYILKSPAIGSDGQTAPYTQMGAFCGNVAFTASTTSANLSCAWVDANSHCSATWHGTNIAGGALSVVEAAGSVSLRSATSVTASADVICDGN